MVKRMVVAAVLMSLAISVVPGIAQAAVLDPDETSGPFDVRSGRCRADAPRPDRPDR